MQFTQTTHSVALGGQTGVLDHGHGRACVQPTLAQFVLNALRATHAHVNDKCQFGAACGGCDGLPVGVVGARAGVARQEDDAMGVFPVGEGYAQRGHRSQTGRDAVDHFHLNPGGAQVLHLFATPAENEGVTALEAHHVFAFVNRHQHEFFDKGLRGGGATTAFSHVNNAGRWRGVGHDGVAHQVIHQQHGGGLNGLQGLDGQHFRIAGAGAYQRALTHAIGAMRVLDLGVIDVVFHT